jgi:hypothetical protein
MIRKCFRLISAEPPLDDFADSTTEPSWDHRRSAKPRVSPGLSVIMAAIVLDAYANRSASSGR